MDLISKKVNIYVDEEILGSHLSSEGPLLLASPCREEASLEMVWDSKEMLAVLTKSRLLE